MGCKSDHEQELPEDPSAMPHKHRLPAALRDCERLEFTMQLTHTGWMRFLRRCLYRYAVRGHHGMVKRVDVYLPSRMAFPCLVDTPGWHVHDLYRNSMTVRAIQDPRVAMLCLLGSGRNVPGEKRCMWVCMRALCRLLFIPY